MLLYKKVTACFTHTMAHILGHHQASGTKLNANLDEHVRSANDGKSHEFSSKASYLYGFPF